jgi:hypothetical protein
MTAGTLFRAWGRFEADGPDKHFQSLPWQEWRKPVLNPENKHDL